MNATALQQFLDLESYYWHYISGFSAIAAPLNGLTQKSITYTWTAASADVF